MESKFSIHGHPIHPMLVVIPIGLFVWAFAADLIYLASDRSDSWYDIAYWTGLAAIATALLAAIPGFADLVTLALKTAARPLALAHMTLNLIVVSLFVVAAVLMFDDGARDGTRLATVVVLHGLGVGALAVSGWLGGEMVFRHRLGITDDGPGTRRRTSRPVKAGLPR